jgi:glutamine---fructose-6-phosphate transaminase (isomerizing)
VNAEQEAGYLHELRHLPAALNGVLALEPQIIAWSEEFARKENALFLGRGLHYPIALEGALKLKEVAYIHAEGYAAGEMKHGPIALINPSFPTIALAPVDGTYEKVVSNIQEIRAREGPVIAVTTPGNTGVTAAVDDVIEVPSNHEILTPLLTVIPLQLFAYYCAVLRGCDVDKPRNLAKSVTVE